MAGLSDYADKGNKEKFTETLLERVINGELPFDLQHAIMAIMSHDNGELMSLLLQKLVPYPKLANDKRLDMESLLEYAGLGQKMDRFCPRVAEALIGSWKFAGLIKEQHVCITGTIDVLCKRSDEQVFLLQKIISRIRQAESKNLSPIIREGLLQALADDQRNCFNSGQVENFKILADHIDQDDAGRVLVRMASIHIAEIGGQHLIAPKLGLLLKKVKPEAIEEGARLAAGSANPEVFEVITQAASGTGTVSFRDAMIGACGRDISGNTKFSKGHSERNLQSLLKAQDYSEDDLFVAIETAVAAQKEVHLATLIAHVQTKHPGSALLRRTTRDGSTLVVKAVNARDKDIADRMAHTLIRNHASIDPDQHGNNPMSILGARGMEKSGAYEAIKRIQGLVFVEMEAAAAMRGRLSVIDETIVKLDELTKRLTGLGLKPEQSGAIIAGLLGAPVSSLQPEPTRTVIEHQTNSVPRADR